VSEQAVDRPIPQAAVSERSGALEALFARYRGALYAYFLRRTRHAADAEDLAQDVFVRLSRLDPAVEMRDAEGFLFRIATNLLRDRARRHRVRHAVLEPLTDIDAADTEPDAERVLQARCELQEVMTLLDSLSERTRHIFILRRFEQMKCQAIADHYGISVNAVEQHIRKALARLSQAMGKP
jgi:RNA polymerase sigma-70 factor (ECF subfamily)